MNGLNWMPLMILTVYGALDSRALLTLMHSPLTFSAVGCRDRIILS
jgi:hypothetical protein